MNRNNNQ